MRLDEMMRDATAHSHPDLARLVRSAESQGKSIRRRRRFAAAGLSVAGVSACVLLVSVASSVTGGPDPDGSRAISSSTPTADPTQQETAPPTKVSLDGRATAALLRSAVDELVEGTDSDFAGQGGSGRGESGDTYAQFKLAPADGEGAGLVAVNVQDLAILKGSPRTCLSFMLDCTVTSVRGGDLLRTYRDLPDTSDGSDIRLVAELLSPSKQLRVVVSATNGFDLGGNEWNVTRRAAVLSAAELRAVAVDERWGFEVAGQYADEGAALPTYRELGGAEALSPTTDSSQAG
jgi:hypothetical protein